jgi:hypothetical protein
MTKDNNTDDSRQPADEAAADPVAVVLMLQQEANNLQPEDSRMSAPLKHAAIKERVLRRMLENSLEPADHTRKPDLKIVK